MDKRTIAIVAGGYSSEIVVSMKSAQGIYSFLDKSRYHVYIVIIDRQGWYVEVSSNERIPVDKNDFSFTWQDQKHKFDFAYITIHGTPGENGLLQGYFEMIGLPYSSCDALCSALTFNKYTCNHYLSAFGIRTAPSVLLRNNDPVSISEIIEQVGLPCFVKPNVGGSSFATTKVKSEAEMAPAIDAAFKEGGEVIVEAFMQGTEITCGCYITKQKSVVFPITEVVTNNEFFDYDAKYNGQVEEITPARIPEKVATTVKETTLKIYRLLGCKGITRTDYILINGEPHLLEINTTPGMTATSFIPQQVKAAKLNITDVMTDIIENEF